MTDPRDDVTSEDLDLDLDLESDESDDDLDLDLGDLDLGEDDDLDLSILDADEPPAIESDAATVAVLASEDAQPQEAPEPEINLDFEGEDVVSEEPALHLTETSAEPEVEEEPLLADTEAAEKAMAELHDRLMMEPGEWYVIHTYSGMENRVKQNLDARVTTLNMEDYIFETVVPTEQVDELRGNQRKTVTRTVLPGYVLVRMELTDESWSTVRHTPSVTGFVGHAQNPVPISLDEVEKMLAPSVIAAATVNTKGPKRIKRKAEVVDFAVGDNVQVDDGPFAGMPATITELNVSNQRAKVLVELLGRETPMELTFAQIKKV